jgi:hypothetical protein
MNGQGGMGQAKDLTKTICSDERWKRYWEGMASDETSLGSMEDGLYFRKEKRRMFLLQEPQREEE